MKITIVDIDTHEKIGFAASQCYNERFNYDDFINADKNKLKAIIKSCIKSGHTSVLEHWNVSFLIEGISLVAVQQLLRHRIASYTQRSLRYTKLDSINDEWYYVPDKIKGKHLDTYIAHMRTCRNMYNKLLADGVAPEDARYVLPSATTSNIFITMNARSLINFFGERMCTKAQKEIRDFATELAKELKAHAPFLFDECKIGYPKCLQINGQCKERNSCGLYENRSN